MTVSWDPGFGPLIDTRMRVATWNLWGRYGPWEERQPIIEANLRAIDADIICLQEAWEEDTRSQPSELADALGMSYVYERAFVMNGGWSGNAVLSRWPIVRHEVDELPMEGGGAADTDEGERRLVVFTEIDGPRGPFQVFCTHLSWRADWSGVRQAQVGKVCEVVRAHTPRSFPAILAGLEIRIAPPPSSPMPGSTTCWSAGPSSAEPARSSKPWWRAICPGMTGFSAATTSPSWPSSATDPAGQTRLTIDTLVRRDYYGA